MWVFCGEMNTKCNNVSCILYITEYHKFKQYNILTTIPTGITYKHTHTQIHTKYNDKKPAPDIQLKKIYSDKFLEKQQKNIYNTFILILSSFKLRFFCWLILFLVYENSMKTFDKRTRSTKRMKHKTKRLPLSSFEATDVKDLL